MTTPEKVTKKLEGTLKKFSYDVWLKDGRQIEFESDDAPLILFDDKAREALLQFGYGVANGIVFSQIAAWKQTINHE